MNFFRIIFGLLLVILPLTGTSCLASTNAEPGSRLDKAHLIKKSTAKDNIYDEEAMLETQEKVSSKTRNTDHDLLTLQNVLSSFFAFQLNPAQKFYTAVLALLTVVPKPFYILYHCLMIPSRL